MSASRAVLYFSLAFISGIFLGSFTKISLPQLLGLLILGLIIIASLWSHKKAAVLGFCFLLLALGIWRWQSIELKIENSGLKKYNDDNEKAVLSGRIFAEPDIRSGNVKLAFEAEKIIINGQEISISGKALITIGKYPAYAYGDKITVEGKLETPPIFEDFNYKDHLEKQGIVSVIYWPQIKLAEKHSTSFYPFVLDFKNKIREVIYQNISGREGQLLAALLLGDQGQMSQELKTSLNNSGLRHITAVSGMNITILSGIFMSLLLGIGLWRRQAFLLSLFLILIFVLMVGFQASAIRAAIMAGIFLFGQQMGRKAIASRAVIFSGAVMLAAAPFLARDIGFQLSFLAIVGLIYFEPIIQGRLNFIPQEKFINLRGIVATTLAAQVFTLPILIYNFGRISVVSPITNVLVLPIIYPLMLLGLVFVLAGLLWSFLGWIFSFPCWFILAYMVKIIEIFSKPWAAFITDKVSWLWLAFIYLALTIFIKYYKKKIKLKFLEY